MVTQALRLVYKCILGLGKQLSTRKTHIYSLSNRVCLALTMSQILKQHHFCQASINLRLLLLFYFSYHNQIKCESSGHAKKYQFPKISICFFLKKKSPIPFKIIL